MNRGVQLAQELTLLQYNVNKSRKKVLIGLFQDLKIQEIDILVIQEPWRNPFNQRGYSAQNTFTLIEVENLNARVSTYINKHLPIDSWSEIYKSNDLITITIQQENQQRHYIHNLYLPPSTHTNEIIPEALAKLQELIQLEGDHTVLGDFNLHHPLWNPGNNGHHILADDVIEALAIKDINLILPKDTITRDVQRGPHHEQSTLDLIFSSIKSIKSCKIDWTLEQASDHFPIRTTLILEGKKGNIPPKPKRNWKKLDLERFLAIIDQRSTSLKALLPLTTKEDIDLYISALVRTINAAIEESTPIKRPSPFCNLF
jgi:hypothetical protein